MSRSDDRIARPATASVWLRAGLVAGLAACGCEAIIGIPDVTLETTTATTSGTGGTTSGGGATTGGGGATSGGGGTGATTSSGGMTTGGGGSTGGTTVTATCPTTPCAGAACMPTQIADASVVVGAGAVATSLFARDGVAHWGTDITAHDVVRTDAANTSVVHPSFATPRRIVDDGQTVVWSAVYQTCLGFWGVNLTSATMSACAYTVSDRSPPVALDETHAYWPIEQIETCSKIPGCCSDDGAKKSCLVSNVRQVGSTQPTILLKGRYAFEDMVRVGSELYFVALDSEVAGKVQRCPLAPTPCVPADFVQGTGTDTPRMLALSGGYIYWTTANGDLRKKPVGAPLGDPYEVVLTDVYITRLIGDDASLYYLFGDVFQLDVTQPNPQPVKIGDAPNAQDLAIDCDHVYWNDGAAAVWRRPR